MNNKLSLENITVLLLAADKLRSAINPNHRADAGVSVSPNKLSIISDTMQIVSGYIPETRKLSFNNALNHCNRYCGVYCDLKKHLRSFKGQSPDATQLITTLKAVMPVLENRQQVPLRKAVSILEVMRST